MGAVQVHTWYSCSFLIAASVRSLTRVKLYFILNASSLRLWHFRGSLFPRYSGLNPPLSLSGSPRILRVFSEVRLPCLSPGGSYVPSPPQYTDLPAGVPFPNPPCHPRSLLPQTVPAYQGNRTSHPGKATGSTGLLSPTILQVPTWLRLLKIGPHNISKFFQCLSVSLSQTAFLILPVSLRNFLW